MAGEKPTTVTVEALQVHSYNGCEYQVGDTYEIDEQFADSVATQGKAIRVDRVARAKQQKADSEKAAKAASKPVAPMSTTSPAARALVKPVKPAKGRLRK